MKDDVIQMGYTETQEMVEKNLIEENNNVIDGDSILHVPVSFIILILLGFILYFLHVHVL